MSRLRLSPRAYRRVTLAAAILLALIIVTGAAVRLTGSGLGCPEWPNCTEGRLTAGASDDVHAQIEFANRMVTGLVSLARDRRGARLARPPPAPQGPDLALRRPRRRGDRAGTARRARRVRAPRTAVRDGALPALGGAARQRDRAVPPRRDSRRHAQPARGRAPATLWLGRLLVAERVGRAGDRDGRHRRRPALRRRRRRRGSQGDAPRLRGARRRADPRHERHGLPRAHAGHPLGGQPSARHAPGDAAARRAARSSSSPRARSGTRSTSTASRRCWWASTSPGRPRCSAPRWPCCWRCTSRCGAGPAGGGTGDAGWADEPRVPGRNAGGRGPGTPVPQQ